MKKSILFGALAFFAVSALSIQDANAQNEVKVNTKKVETVSEKQEKPAISTVAQEPVKKDDCCAGKKVCTEKKEGKDCCADKKLSGKKDNCSADKKLKAESKMNNKEAVVKPATKDVKKPKSKK